MICQDMAKLSGDRGHQCANVVEWMFEGEEPASRSASNAF
jgi:hypothetical protein